MPARKTKPVEWLLCTLLLLGGCGSIGLHFKKREAPAPREELLLLEGRPANVELSVASGRHHVHFEIEDRRISYSSNEPEFVAVLDALASQDVLRVGVSSLPESLRQPGDTLPLRQVEWRNRLILNPERVAEERANSALALVGLGGFLILLGMVGVWAGIRNNRKVRSEAASESEPNPDAHERKTQRFVTILVSVLFYLVILGVELDPKIRAKLVEAFGAELGGVPIVFVVMFVETLLYLPMPYFFWHLARILIQARNDGRRLTLGYILDVTRTHPELSGSRAACLGGILYFAIIAGAWIIYTSRLGI